MKQTASGFLTCLLLLGLVFSAMNIKADSTEVLTAPMAGEVHSTYTDQAINAALYDVPGPLLRYANMHDPWMGQTLGFKGYNYTGGGAYGGWWPPPFTANVTWVNLLVVAYSTYWTDGYGQQYYKTFSMTYSTDGGLSWPHTSPPYTCTGVETEYRYNVTTYENWTISILRSWDMEVQIDSLWWPWSPSLYVNYVGLEYGWTNASYTPPVPPPPSGWNWTGNTTGAAIMGMIGTVGFVGMVITPMLGVWAWKTQENRFQWLFKIFLVGVFSFALFIAALGL